MGNHSTVRSATKKKESISEYGAKFSTRHGNPAILHHLSIKGVVTHGNMTHHAIYNQIKTIIMKSHFNLDVFGFFIPRRFRVGKVFVTLEDVGI